MSTKTQQPETIYVTLDGFHGPITLAIRGIWQPWDPHHFAVRLTDKAYRSLATAVACLDPQCTCPGYPLPRPFHDTKTGPAHRAGLYLVPGEWLSDADVESYGLAPPF